MENCMNQQRETPDLQQKKVNALQCLREYVSALQEKRMGESFDPKELEHAEKALFALDPKNPLIGDFADSRKNVLEIIFQESGVDFVPKPIKPAIEFPNIETVQTDCRFFGKCVLFTGFSQDEKDQLARIADFLQIDQPSAVCQKLDFLICGSNAGPSKIKKAEAMRKPIIQVEDFFREITGGEIAQAFTPPSAPEFPESFLTFDDKMRLPSSGELDNTSDIVKKRTAFIGVYDQNLQTLQTFCRNAGIHMRLFCDTSCPVWVHGPYIGQDFTRKVRDRKSAGNIVMTFPEWITAISKKESEDKI